MPRYIVFLLIISTNCLKSQFQIKEPIKIVKPGVDQLDLKEKRKRQKSGIIQDSILKISAVGDMMLGTQYPSRKYLPPIESMVFKPNSTLRTPNFFDKIEHTLKKHHIVFGNLEGTFFDSSGHVKRCSDSSKCYAFKQPTHYVKSLSNAGFNLISVGNNHIGDFGINGIKSTHNTLKTEGIHHAGTNVKPIDFMDINGQRVGFLALAVGEDCVQLHDTSRIKNLLFELKSFCNIIIVSIHAGAEGNNHTHVTRKSECYLEENRGNVYEVAHFCIDQGADLILGHGPHVPRALEVYRKKLIAYSLGNFCTYYRFNLSKNNGIAPLLSLELKRNGDIQKIDICSYKQIGNGGPISDWRNRAKHRILRLSKQDFPESFQEIKRLLQ